MKKTPIHERHLALGARMTPFAGWALPVQYDGITTEHLRTRAACSMFDVSHMGEFEISGPAAARDLDRLLTQPIESLAEGQCRYGYLLREDGGVLDDLTCYRLGPERFLLVVNAGPLATDAAWIRERLSAETRFEDRSAATAKLDIQGPSSRAAMEEALGTGLPDLKYFRAAPVVWQGVSCLLSRTGYTGEWGYEVYAPADEAVRFWDLFTGSGISPAGLGARDTLRLEMGYPLYGHELSVDRTPVPAARGAFIDLDKDFIGRDAVRRDIVRGCARTLAGLRLESRRAARPGDAVLDGDREAGVITSGSYAPSLGVAVALALLDAARGEPGARLQVAARGARLAAEVVALPFYTVGSARKAAGKKG